MTSVTTTTAIEHAKHIEAKLGELADETQAAIADCEPGEHVALLNIGVHVLQCRQRVRDIIARGEGGAR